MNKIGPNENWRQLLFLFRQYRIVQDIRKKLDHIEWNYKRDWQQYIDEIGQDPLELVWDLGKVFRRKKFFGKGEVNAWSEPYWVEKMKNALQCNRTYIEFFSRLYGVAAISSSGILGMVGDPSRFRGLRSLWHYCGLHVVKGKAPRLRRGQAIDWNPQLKSLLLGNVANCLILKKSHYRGKFEQYKKEEIKKHNWKTCESCQYVYKKSKKDTRKGHINNRAKRKVVKNLIKDLWNYWQSGELP